MVVMSGATLAVSSVALGVMRTVTRRQQRSKSKPCTRCNGNGFLYPCDVCLGKAVIRSRAPRTFKQLLAEARGKGAKSVAPEDLQVQCSCPACGTTMHQRCLNCLGEGAVYIPA
jgi:predicted RNA-binding Zn-ribbon protein involved in translation (DUF1610 family)